MERNSIKPKEIEKYTMLMDQNTQYFEDVNFPLSDM